MARSQLDLIRKQTEAAARNAVAGATGRLRRETSLVGRASRLAGQSIRDGETAWKNRRRQSKRSGNTATVETEPEPVQIAEDGYIRRSPVQGIRVAADYRKKIILRIVGVAVLIVAACVAFRVVGNLGLFGR